MADPRRAPLPTLRLVRSVSLSEASDADLARAAAGGDPAAAPELWSRFSVLVRGLLRRSVGSDTDLEDDTQEVFMRLFRLVPKLRDPEALRSFVVGITVRVARKRLTSRWVQRWLHLTPTGHAPDVYGSEVDHDSRETLRRFYDLLDTMGGESRLIFTLRHIEGMELTEVAAALDVSLATVKRRLARIEKRVRGSMSRDPLLATLIPHEHEA
jgi:RNA polymerase sigma-70 factor, ECF subfamily